MTSTTEGLEIREPINCDCCGKTIGYSDKTLYNSEIGFVNCKKCDKTKNGPLPKGDMRPHE